MGASDQLRRRGRRGVALMDAILGGVMLGIGLAVILSLASRSVAMCLRANALHPAR